MLWSSSYCRNVVIKTKEGLITVNHKKHIFTCSEWALRLSVHHWKIIKGIVWVCFLLILLHCTKIISYISYLSIARKLVVTYLCTVPKTKWCGENDDPRTRIKKDGSPGSLSSNNIACLIQTALEAELSQALGCDGGVITTRWINICVVKVKWCYVVPCYWTWPVTLHDTTPFHALPLSLLQTGLRLRPCNDPEKRVKCWSLCPLNQWTIWLQRSVVVQ